MRIERHTTFDALDEEWDDLADRSGAIPWVRPGWIRPWHDAFGTGSPELVALRRDDGALAALAPLERRGGMLASPTNWHTPEFALLAEDDDARAGLVGALVGRRPRRLQLSFMPPEGGGLGETRLEARSRRFRLVERVVERSPYIPVEGDWASYRASLSKGVRKDLDRRHRRLKEQGELAFQLLDGRESLDEYLDEGFRIEGSGWKTENGTAILSRPETTRFYTEVSRWAAERGWLRLSFLRLDDRPIAFELNLEVGRRFYVLKGGYDDEFRKYGPGLRTLEEIVRYCHDHQLESYEFLGSDEPYKLDWTSRTRDRMLLQAFSPTLPGLADYAAYAVGRPAAKRLLELRRRGGE